jgi:hypothetical protein
MYIKVSELVYSMATKKRFAITFPAHNLQTTSHNAKLTSTKQTLKSNFSHNEIIA